ncbi:hypothetical protein BH10ACT11_BH10ACT11_21470 [soil metagenome]
MLLSSPRVATVVLALVGLGALAIALPAQAGSAKAGKYAGTLHPTDASNHQNDTKIKFKVDSTGNKIKSPKADFYYFCNGALQYYVFPAQHKGAIKIKSNKTFKARDVIDKKAGFYVYFFGKFKSKTKAKGTLQLTTNHGCGRTLKWSAKRN